MNGSNKMAQKKKDLAGQIRQKWSNDDQMEIKIDSIKFTQNERMTIVRIMVKMPKRMIDRKLELDVPTNIMISAENNGVLFTGEFVFTDELKELEEFVDYTHAVVNNFIFAATMLDTYKKLENAVNNSLKNIDLDMDRVRYREEHTDEQDCIDNADWFRPSEQQQEED